jgi:DNA-binding IclR family transcriptional regulator
MTDWSGFGTNGRTKRHTAVPAVERALALLRILAKAGSPLTLAELSESIGASRSTVYSILATLQDQGFVEKDPRYKTYRLGVATLELGSAYLAQVTLLPAFNEMAQRLVAACGETVKLAVLDGRDVVYLGKQEGLYSVRLVARVGSRMPAHATAVGKVLLAQLPPDILELLYARYDFPTLTPNTIRSFEALQRELDQVRKQGCAHDIEESSIGLQCVAMPVRDHSGAVVAAVSIGVPNDRLSPERMGQLTDLLRQHVLDLSRTLGWAESQDSLIHPSA